MDLKRLKKIIRNIVYEVIPHVIPCTILSLFDPAQAGMIFLVGLFLPDFLVLFSKLTAYPARRNEKCEKIVKYPYLRYYRIRNIIKTFHVLTFLISVVALFLGYPLIFLAGLSHIVLDAIGY